MTLSPLQQVKAFADSRNTATPNNAFAEMFAKPEIIEQNSESNRAAMQASSEAQSNSKEPASENAKLSQ